MTRHNGRIGVEQKPNGKWVSWIELPGDVTLETQEVETEQEAHALADEAAQLAARMGALAWRPEAENN